MDERNPRPWYAQLPAKLAAIVVFLVALTTLVGNLFELVDKRAASVAVPVAPEPSSQAGPASQSQPALREGPVELRIDRIVVEHDGSPGTTDWRFSIEIDGEPMLAFPQDALDDTEGRNVAVPGEPPVRASLGERGNARVVVKAWRGSWFKFGTAPDAVGEGWLTATGGIGTIRVAAEDPMAGAFVFHVSTTP